MLRPVWCSRASAIRRSRSCAVRSGDEPLSGAPVRVMMTLVRAWFRPDPRQARLFTLKSLCWVVRQRAFTPWYLLRYWRLLKLRVTQPQIVLRGMVFLGRNVELRCAPGLAQMEIGRWVHLGDGTAIRCHEGSLRIGDKAVFGRHNTVNSWLDVEVGASTLTSDWIYVCDFDH